MRAASEAYLLHTRPYQDSSVLAECFTREQGVLTLLAKGAKRPRSAFYGLLQPFIALQLTWVGKRDLKTLVQAEASCASPTLVRHKLLLGLYLNELLARLLHRLDPYLSLYDTYKALLQALSQAQTALEEQRLLRQFELRLLAALGYGIDLYYDVKGKALVPEKRYVYIPALGLQITTHSEDLVFQGSNLIALREDTLTESQMLDAKQLMRAVLKHYLGNKPLQSRKLFYHYREEA